MTHPMFGANVLAKDYPPPMVDPMVHVYWNDFSKPTDYDTNDWTLTTVEAGAGSATEAISNAENGVLLVTNDAADDDSDFFQLAKETFKFVADKRTGFMVRFKTSDATQSDLVFGLQITDTTPLAVTDGVYFRKDDGDAYLDIVSIKDSVATTATAIATLANDTWVAIAFEFDGYQSIHYYVGGVKKGTLTVTSTLPDDEELTVSFGIQNGEAVAKTLSVDYIGAWKER